MYEKLVEDQTAHKARASDKDDVNVFERVTKPYIDRLNFLLADIDTPSFGNGKCIFHSLLYMWISPFMRSSAVLADSVENGSENEEENEYFKKLTDFPGRGEKSPFREKAASRRDGNTSKPDLAASVNLASIRDKPSKLSDKLTGTTSSGSIGDRPERFEREKHPLGAMLFNEVEREKELGDRGRFQGRDVQGAKYHHLSKYANVKHCSC